jgi:hypothetical protein
MSLFTRHHRIHLYLLACLMACNSTAQASWFGPKTANLEGGALTEKMQAHPVVISTSSKPLEIKTKAAAVGGFVLGFVLSSAAASGSVRSGQSAQQLSKTMDTNLKMAMSFNRNIQELVKSTAAEQAGKSAGQVASEGPFPLVINQVIPSLLASHDIKVRLEQKDEPVPAEDLQLSFRQTEWKVDFSLTSSDYTLNYAMQVQLFQKSSNTVFFTGSCTDSTRQMPLEDWQKDDSAALAKASLEIAQQCATQLLSKLQLKLYVIPAKATESAVAPASTQIPNAETPVAAMPVAPTSQEASAKPVEAVAESPNKTLDTAGQDKPPAK